MEQTYTNQEARLRISERQNRGEKVSFVSTMGGLHEGHLSLVRRAKEVSDYVVASIFLNPLHFSENEDFDRYPRTEEQDCELLEGAGCDLVWLPKVEQLYPFGVSGNHFSLRDCGLSGMLCGKSRPHFFEGVATIVLKEFNVLLPNIAVFGEKDFQQLLICQRMVADLHLPIEIFSGPTVREKNGLAMSSRNQYLTESQKTRASIIYDTLVFAREEFERNSMPTLEIVGNCVSRIQEKGLSIDYFEILRPDTLGPVDIDTKSVRILAAAYLDGVRLIDNLAANRG